VQHHAEGLRRLTDDDALVEQLKTDYRSADIDSRLRAMLDYAVRLTLTPHEIKQSDIERLRDEGLSDRAILDLNLVVGYFAFVNRLADGLGVELESWWETET
jgi:uncharacterized peroxidase-related enzyme